MTHNERGVAFGSVNLGRVVKPFDTLEAQGLDEHHQQTKLGLAQVFHSLREKERKDVIKRNKYKVKQFGRRSSAATFPAKKINKMLQVTNVHEIAKTTC